MLWSNVAYDQRTVGMLPGVSEPVLRPDTARSHRRAMGAGHHRRLHRGGGPRRSRQIVDHRPPSIVQLVISVVPLAAGVVWFWPWSAVAGVRTGTAVRLEANINIKDAAHRTKLARRLETAQRHELLLTRRMPLQPTNPAIPAMSSPTPNTA